MEDAWREVLERLLRGLERPSGSGGPEAPARPAPPLRVHVLGSTDTGKTTFCRWLGGSLTDEGLGAVGVDCDPGQSAVGPPATVGMGWEPCREGRAEAIRFVGHVTPSGHFLQLLTGIVALRRRAAAAGADAVVFDASGFMDTPAGREYHTLLVEATVGGGGHLVLLQREAELEPVASAFAKRRDVVVHRLRPSAAVEPRSRDRRRGYRRTRFRAHFEGAGQWRLGLEGLGRTGRVPDLRPGRAPGGLLVAVVDREGEDRGPHVLLGVEADGAGAEERATLRLHGSPVRPEEVTAVRFGALRLEPGEWGG